MKLVDVAEVAEDRVGPGSSLCQVGDGELVLVVPQNLVQVVDVPDVGVVDRLFFVFDPPPK